MNEQQKKWAASGVVEGNRWMTAVDEHVCPLCRALHEVVAPLGQPFRIPPERMTPELEQMTDAGLVEAVCPPMHGECRCYLQPVVTEDALERELLRILGE